MSFAITCNNWCKHLNIFVLQIHSPSTCVRNFWRFCVCVWCRSCQFTLPFDLPMNWSIKIESSILIQSFRDWGLKRVFRALLEAIQRLEQSFQNYTYNDLLPGSFLPVSEWGEYSRVSVILRILISENQSFSNVRIFFWVHQFSLLRKNDPQLPHFTGSCETLKRHCLPLLLNESVLNSSMNCIIFE